MSTSDEKVPVTYRGLVVDHSLDVLAHATPAWAVYAVNSYGLYRLVHVVDAVLGPTQTVDAHNSIARAISLGLYSVDGIPWEIHALPDPAAREAAIHAYADRMNDLT